MHESANSTLAKVTARLKYVPVLKSQRSFVNMTSETLVSSLSNPATVVINIENTNAGQETKQIAGESSTSFAFALERTQGR